MCSCTACCLPCSARCSSCRRASLAAPVLVLVEHVTGMLVICLMAAGMLHGAGAQ